MALNNWTINSIPIGTWNTLCDITSGEDCCIFSYKIQNRGSGTANLVLGLTNSSVIALSAPANVVVTPQGTAGNTEYSYKVTAVNTRGETIASTAAITSTGNATLDSVNFNRITWDAVSGAVEYNVYGRLSGLEQYIGTVTTTTFDDTGTSIPANYPPSINTTHIKFRFVQKAIEASGFIESVSERIGLTSGDSLVVFSDGTKVDIIAFGDLLNLS